MEGEERRYMGDRVSIDTIAAILNIKKAYKLVQQENSKWHAGYQRHSQKTAFRCRRGTHHCAPILNAENGLQLGLDHVDLFLLHVPEKLFPKGSPSQEEAWAQLEELQQEGLTKSIGVSNHRVQDLERILKTGKVVPAINQVSLFSLAIL